MTAVPSPAARRLRGDRRDARLALGVGLVVLSVALGGRVLASAGDRVPVWSLRHPLAAGTTLTGDDLVALPVSADSVAAYVPATRDVTGRVLSRDVGAGELLPAAAVTERVGGGRRLVTVAVDALHEPPGLARGERVDVYVSPREGASTPSDGSASGPALVLPQALVADPGSLDTAGTTTQVGVVIEVAPADAARAVAAARGGAVDLVRVGS